MNCNVCGVELPWTMGRPTCSECAPYKSKSVVRSAMATPQPPPTGQGADVTQAVIAELRQRDRVAAQFGIAIDESLTQTLIEELMARSAAGVKKYGTVLRANNGRDALLDGIQEAYDLCCYLMQAYLEQPHHEGLHLQFENAVNILRELRKLYGTPLTSATPIR